MTDEEIYENLLEDATAGTQASIRRVCNSLLSLLLEKNKRYGDSAVNPTKIFSKLASSEGILVRLDDKLNRVINSAELRKDGVADILGYLVLLCVSKGWTDFSEFID